MSSSAKLLWLAAYVCAIVAVVWFAMVVREQVVARLSTPEAEREWTEWRKAAQEQANKGPVARRPPKTREPPALIVLRDHFPAVVAAGVVFGTFLFAILFVTARALCPSGERSGSITVGKQPSGPI